MDNGDTPVAVIIEGTVDVNQLGKQILTYAAADFSAAGSETSMTSMPFSSVMSR